MTLAHIRLKHVLLTMLVAVIMSFGMAEAAHAKGPFWVGGGKWYYGTVRGGDVWSNYLHNYRCHSSTAVGKWRAWSGRTARGYWAMASAPERRWRADEAYWNNRC